MLRCTFKRLFNRRKSRHTQFSSLWYMPGLRGVLLWDVPIPLENPLTDSVNGISGGALPSKFDLRLHRRHNH
jgi:hypothetical protein